MQAVLHAVPTSVANSMAATGRDVASGHAAPFETLHAAHFVVITPEQYDAASRPLFVALMPLGAFDTHGSPGDAPRTTCRVVVSSDPSLPASDGGEETFNVVVCPEHVARLLGSTTTVLYPFGFFEPAVSIRVTIVGPLDESMQHHRSRQHYESSALASPGGTPASPLSAHRRRTPRAPPEHQFVTASIAPLFLDHRRVVIAGEHFHVRDELTGAAVRAAVAASDPPDCAVLVHEDTLVVFDGFGGEALSPPASPQHAHGHASSRHMSPPLPPRNDGSDAAVLTSPPPPPADPLRQPTHASNPPPHAATARPLPLGATPTNTTTRLHLPTPHGAPQPIGLVSPINAPPSPSAIQRRSVSRSPMELQPASFMQDPLGGDATDATSTSSSPRRGSPLHLQQSPRLSPTLGQQQQLTPSSGLRHGATSAASGRRNAAFNDVSFGPTGAATATVGSGRATTTTPARRSVAFNDVTTVDPVATPPAYGRHATPSSPSSPHHHNEVVFNGPSSTPHVTRDVAERWRQQPQRQPQPHQPPQLGEESPIAAPSPLDIYAARVTPTTAAAASGRRVSPRGSPRGTSPPSSPSMRQQRRALALSTSPLQQAAHRGSVSPQRHARHADPAALQQRTHELAHRWSVLRAAWQARFGSDGSSGATLHSTGTPSSATDEATLEASLIDTKAAATSLAHAHNTVCAYLSDARAASTQRGCSLVVMGYPRDAPLHALSLEMERLGVRVASLWRVPYCSAATANVYITHTPNAARHASEVAKQGVLVVNGRNVDVAAVAHSVADDLCRVVEYEARRLVARVASMRRAVPFDWVLGDHFAAVVALAGELAQALDEVGVDPLDEAERVTRVVDPPSGPNSTRGSPHRGHGAVDEDAAAAAALRSALRDVEGAVAAAFAAGSAPERLREAVSGGSVRFGDSASHGSGDIGARISRALEGLRDVASDAARRAGDGAGWAAALLHLHGRVEDAVCALEHVGWLYEQTLVRLDAVLLQRLCVAVKLCDERQRHPGDGSLMRYLEATRRATGEDRRPRDALNVAADRRAATAGFDAMEREAWIAVVEAATSGTNASSSSSPGFFARLYGSVAGSSDRRDGAAAGGTAPQLLQPIRQVFEGEDLLLEQEERATAAAASGLW